MAKVLAAVPLLPTVITWLFAPSSASAGLVTETFSFTFANFQSVDVTGFPAPVDPVTGSVTITFDPSIDYLQDVTTGITLNSLNIVLDSPIGFNYHTIGQQLRIGGIQDGVDAIIFNLLNPTVNDVFFTLGVGSSPYATDMGYVQAGIPTGFYSPIGSLSVSTVPEPGGILYLAASGLAGFVAIRKRFKK